MTKKLTEMTKEELWQRFPIVLTCHQAHWAKWYREEEASLLAAFSGMPVVRISHIGEYRRKDHLGQTDCGHIGGNNSRLRLG